MKSWEDLKDIFHRVKEISIYALSCMSVVIIAGMIAWKEGDLFLKEIFPSSKGSASAYNLYGDRAATRSLFPTPLEDRTQRFPLGTIVIVLEFDPATVADGSARTVVCVQMPAGIISTLQATQVCFISNSNAKPPRELWQVPAEQIQEK